MAASDSRPIPRKNTAFRVTFPIFDADGNLKTGAAGLDSEVSIDGGTFSDCTNEATEIATASGVYYLDLSSGEMNGDTIAVIVKSDAKTAVITIYPEELGDVRVDVGQISGDATAADNAEAFFDGTGYAGTNNVIPSVTAAGLVDGAITAAKIASDAITAAKVASDAIAEIQSGLATPTNITAGTITTVTNLTNAPTNGDLTATMKASVTTAATAATPIAASVTGNVGGNVVGSVASVTNGVTIATGAITAATIATDAIDADALAADAVAEINATVDAAISDAALATASSISTLSSKVLKYFQLLFRKDSAIATDNATELTAINANGGSGTGAYANTTDSVEALRDRGDAAWVTASGFSTHSAADVWANGTRTLTANTNLNDPTAAAIADAVLDEAMSGHATAGTLGKAIADVLADTGTDGVVVASGSKAGYSLAADQSGVTVGTVNALGTQAKADVNAQVVDTLNVDTYAEPTSTPSATASLAAKIGWLMKLARNKLTQSSTTQTLYADDGVTAQNTATVTDDGDTFTKGEWS